MREPSPRRRTTVWMPGTRRSLGAWPGRRRGRRRGRAGATLALAAMLAALAASAVGCGPVAAGSAEAGAHGAILAVGAENEYADVIAQVGGRYVQVSSILSNPNTDPHSFEASPSVAQTVAQARLVVQNGVGYDSWMERLEEASPDPARRVLNVQHVLGLPDSTRNPHLWYSPRTMPALAVALAGDLAALQPAHAAYFRARAARFEASLQPWLQALRAFAARYGGVPVAATEPVADYMLQAAGARVLTPFTLQADIMNGIDPAPQNVSLGKQLLSERRVRVLLYNEQVVDTLTESFLEAAQGARVPVVGVYETMPHGYDYQSWMLAETAALRRAVAEGASTHRL